MYLDAAALGQQRLQLSTENAALRAVLRKVEEGTTVTQVGACLCPAPVSAHYEHIPCIIHMPCRLYIAGAITGSWNCRPLLLFDILLCCCFGAVRQDVLDDPLNTLVVVNSRLQNALKGSSAAKHGSAAGGC